MLALAALLLAAPLQSTPDTLPRADAYLDVAAREWIAGARERQRERDRSVQAYTATVQERAWAGLRTLGRDRTLFSMRTAAQVEWDRDGGARVTVTGSRMMDPEGEVEAIGPRDTGPAGLAYDPADDPLVIRLGDSAWVRHPLAPGSEAFYRFRTGPLTSISVPGGRTVRVVEIGVEPRRDDPRLLRGSLWLDADTRAPVRIVFRPAAPLVMNLGFQTEKEEERRNINLGATTGGGSGWLGGAEAEVKYVTVEYGLYEGRWWMLRSLAAEGVARARALGLSAAIPMRWERAYADYQVRGTPPGEPVAAVVPLDTATAERPGGACPAKRPEGFGCRCFGGVCRMVRVEVPADTAALLASAELPPSFAEEGARTLAGTDIDELEELLRQRIPPVWALRSPRIGWLLPGPGLLRYNRVEGLSVGAGVDADFGPVAADLRVRIGTADREPNAELGLTRQGGQGALRLAGYHRLDTVEPAAHPFGAGNSLGALLWGRDVGDYFRTAGAELIGGPPPTERPWYEWRLFAERQTAAERSTDFSVWDAVGGGGDFRPNITADRADQMGASLALRGSWEGRPGGPRGGAELWAEGSAGTFGFARPRLQLAGALPLPGRLWGSLEGAAGGSAGDVPTQSLWYLGGPATLRGYDGAAARGTAFWRARGELATRGPATRLGIFGDAGWAGDRGAFGEGRTLASVGVGASVLDGWLRLDVARALVAPTGWGVYLSVEPVR